MKIWGIDERSMIENSMVSDLTFKTFAESITFFLRSIPLSWYLPAQARKLQEKLQTPIQSEMSAAKYLLKSFITALNYCQNQV